MGRIGARLAIPALFAALAAAPAAAQPAPPPEPQGLPPAVIAVIDYQLILRDSAAAKSIRDQIEGRRVAYQEEIAQAEQRLRTQDRELSNQRSLLTPEAFAERRKAFEEDVAQVQRSVQERRRILDESSGRALNTVREALIDIVTGFAETQGFNLVLPNSDVLFFSRQIDLTDDVMAELDRRLPRVQVTFDAP